MEGNVQIYYTLRPPGEQRPYKVSGSRHQERRARTWREDGSVPASHMVFHGSDAVGVPCNFIPAGLRVPGAVPRPEPSRASRSVVPELQPRLLPPQIQPAAASGYQDALYKRLRGDLSRIGRRRPSPTRGSTRSSSAPPSSSPTTRSSAPLQTIKLFLTSPQMHVYGGELTHIFLQSR